LIYTPEQLEDWRQRALRVEQEVARAVVGRAGTVRLIKRNKYTRHPSAPTRLETQTAPATAGKLRPFACETERYRYVA
jgi:hypothetical protein